MENDRTILVTGAAGYLGSHACVALLESGFGVVGVDNFDNSHREVVSRIQSVGGPIAFHELDVRDSSRLSAVFAEHDIWGVMHFAGLKAVGDSVRDPLRYFDVNVGSSVSLLKCMREADVTRLVFSSSCTVYGDPDPELSPICETTATRATNPYGRSKVIIERILEDLCAADPTWRVFSLRYFNPVGAHESGRLGEDPKGVPTNLMPYIMQTAAGRRDEVSVFGGDYPTPDGTCIRDYIHVVDLVEGHVRALEAVTSCDGFEAINLGTGIGSSVLDVMSSAERAIRTPIAHRIVDRRAGDASVVYADPSLAEERLGWRAKRDLVQMCTDHWRWQRLNPDGYSIEAGRPHHP